MAGYPLTALLASRRFREDAAARETRLAREAEELARAAAAKAGEELRRYREWRPGEEARLFERLRGKIVPRSELDRHHGDVQTLRQTEIEKESASLLAEKAVEKAAAELERAREFQIAAIRNREKLDMHREIWLAAEKKRLEAAEEAEMEDFTSRSPLDDESGAEAPGAETEAVLEAAEF